MTDVLRRTRALVAQIRDDIVPITLPVGHLRELLREIDSRVVMSSTDARALIDLMLKYDFDMKLREDPAAERAGDAINDHAIGV